MATESQNIKEYKTEEIDLLDILLRVWNGLGKALRAISIFLIKKSLWLTGFVLLGVGVAFLFYSISQRYYTSTMVAQMNVLSNTYVVDYINRLGEAKDSLVYAKALSIPVSAAKHISSVNSFFGIDTDGDNNVDYVDVTKTFQFNIQDSIKRKVPKIFYVQVTVSEPSIFPLINKGITTTLKSNPHFIERNKIRIAQVQTTIAELEEQYRRLDSLERFEYFSNALQALKTSGQILILNEKERQLYHEPLLKIRDEIFLQKQELSLYSEPITIIQDFPALSIVDNPLDSYMETWILIFLGAGILILIVKQNWKRISKIVKEKRY
ncbi:MAG: hypothetical protein LBT49_00045 [Prevotellaceae bacterium]|jgi:hypothetical protein|nr:hypothetical protein [Prevotellaceae bacterium]